MISAASPIDLYTNDKINHILQELGIPVYRIGYTNLCLAIPLYAQNPTQSVCKELYPAVANILGNPDWRSVEHSIRVVIVAAWNNKDPTVWEHYFPGCQRPPSNKQFIATLAELCKS